MGLNYALVVDDHPLVASGIASFLSTNCRFKQAFVVTNEENCYRHIRHNGPPRLLVIDFWLSSGTALNLLKEVKKMYPQVRLLVVSGDDYNNIWQKVFSAGGHGFVLKSEPPDLFSRAVFALLDDLTWFPEKNILAVTDNNENLRSYNLTPRQLEILNMIMRGLPNKKIAIQLSISEPTVKEHTSNILKKIGVNSRVELITLLHGNWET
ncbi:DNA-binding response regulator [Cronobacter dublinensis]|uniref:DNA-binding response regulator n=1 Tax=Cronobacter dublinensis TaxID=413497 RepID=A0A9Q4XQT3_9ENTR|nr:DNA-binding response regulator [Cronobacter dublinensis]